MAVFYGASAVAGATWADGFPRSFWPIELLLSCATLGGVRFGIRAASDATPGRGRAGAADHRATLLYGAGQTGALLARSARRHPGSGVLPVGFLDDDPTLAGGIVAGMHVYGGLDSMARAVADDRRPDPPHHDAERGRERGPPGRGRGAGPRSRGPHGPVR